jgi:hypothetical protein
MDSFNKNEVKLIFELAEKNTDRKVQEMRQEFDNLLNRFDASQAVVKKQIEYQHWIFASLLAAYVILKLFGKV